MPYLYDLPDWPQFTWDRSVKALLLEAARRQGVLQGCLREIGFSVALAHAALPVLVEDAVQTSAIEGETLNVNSVRSSVARRLGIESSVNRRDDRDIDGLVEMLVDSTQNRAKPLTAERLYGWHAGMFADRATGFDSITVGAWRVDPVVVVSGAIGRQKTHYEAPATNLAD